ncbi:hypothetical protein BHE74_00045584 [Ensete ventricosum]|nr:hypothetical protein BHE74_00045584 [Ensete ventricosum]
MRRCLILPLEDEVAPCPRMGRGGIASLPCSHMGRHRFRRYHPVVGGPHIDILSDWYVSLAYILKILFVILQVDGKTVMKFAVCYGFRNLQNIVRKIRIGKCDYHFVEVMACPSGMLYFANVCNVLLKTWSLIYRRYIYNIVIWLWCFLSSMTWYLIHLQVEVADPFDNSIVKRLYDEWLGQPGSEKARRYLHTEYHPLVKSTASQLLNW